MFGNHKGIAVHSINRLQRWAATLLGYDFRIEYGKSADFGQSDAISRLISSNSAPGQEVVAALQAEFDMDVLTSYLPATFDKIRSITEKAVLLQSVKKFTKSGWPDLKTSPPARRLVTLRRVLLTPRVPHDRGRMWPVRGTWGYFDRTLD